MADFTIDTSGIDIAINMLAELDTLAENAVFSAVLQAATSCAEASDVLVPVDTGELRDSEYTKVATITSSIDAEVGFDSDHAVYVELGHHTRGGGSWVPAQPYLLPSFEIAVQQLTLNLQNLDV